jgi:hypothetical protein
VTEIKSIQGGCVRWGALWRSKNELDGQTKHLLFQDCMPVLFQTRSQSRRWIESKYGYIRKRLDLQAEPFGWKMPTPIRVKIMVSHDLSDKRTKNVQRVL